MAPLKGAISIQSLVALFQASFFHQEKKTPFKMFTFNMMSLHQSGRILFSNDYIYIYVYIYKIYIWVAARKEKWKLKGSH